MVAATKPHTSKENKKTTNAQRACDYFGITVKEVLKQKVSNK